MGFPEEFLMKNTDGLRNGFLRLPLIKLFKKISFATITEDLVIKYKDNYKKNCEVFTGYETEIT